MAWLRLASAAVVLCTRGAGPGRSCAPPPRDERLLIVAFGAVLAVMNAAFYLALDRLPLATVASLEFLGILALAAYGARTPRNPPPSAWPSPASHS